MNEPIGTDTYHPLASREDAPGDREFELSLAARGSEPRVTCLLGGRTGDTTHFTSPSPE